MGGLRPPSGAAVMSSMIMFGLPIHPGGATHILRNLCPPLT